MLVPDQIQILFCAEPIDMRNGYNGLAGIVRNVLDEEPVTGKLFVFRGKKSDSVKILYWHYNGFAVWSKKLQKGSFQFPERKSGSTQITRSALRMILEGINTAALQRHK